MPNYVNLGEAADSFFKNFYQAKQFKQQKKDRENDIILQAGMRQLSDETLPLRERNNLFNELVRLAGGKKGEDYAQLIGLRHLEDEDVQVGTQAKNQATIIGSADNPDKTPVPVNNTNQTVEQPPVPIFGRKQVVESILKKRGDLSPLDLKSLAKEAEDNREAAAKLKQIVLQKTLLPNYDPYINKEDGSTVLVNKDNPSDTINLPKGLVPASVYNVGQRTSLPKGKLAERLTANSIRLGKPIDSPEVMEASQKDLDELFDADLKYKTGSATRTQQAIEGTTPLTPAQKVDDERANREEQQRKDQFNREERQRALNVYQDYSNAKAAKEQAFSLKTEIGKARDRYKTKGEELQANIQSLEKVVKPTDKKLIQLKKEYEANSNDYEKQDEAYNKAQAAETEALNKMNASANMGKVFGKHLNVKYGNNNYPLIEILPEASSINGMTDINNKTYGGGEAYKVEDGITFSEAQKVEINKVRQLNPKATAGKSDSEVHQMILNQINKNKNKK